VSPRARAFAVTLVTLALKASDARADDEHASCDRAFERAELHRRPSAGRLLDARAALRTCALPSCQSWMVDDCTKRLAEVEGRIPSVVFSAENARRIPVYDVRVLEGERELAARIDGRAVEMDPGPHQLVAVRGDARVPLSIVVIEGKKAQQVAFAFQDAPPPAPPPVEAPEPPPSPEEPAYPWARPLAGGLLIGGIVGAGLGVGFGVAAISKKHDAHCDDDDVCDFPVDDARDAARASTISFIAGGALALGSAITFLLFGRAHVKAGPHQVQVGVTW
jgi:hypothetical protein